jgi:hypothetical protein
MGPVRLNLPLSIIGLALMLVACSDPPMGRPPLVNSGSYDWRDAYRGPDGYPLPGWGGYFKSK